MYLFIQNNVNIKLTVRGNESEKKNNSNSYSTHV